MTPEERAEHERQVQEVFWTTLHPHLRKLILELIAINGPPGHNQYTNQERLIEEALDHVGPQSTQDQGITMIRRTMIQWRVAGYPIIPDPRNEVDPPPAVASRLALLQETDPE